KIDALLEIDLHVAGGLERPVPAMARVDVGSDRLRRGGLRGGRGVLAGHGASLGATDDTPDASNAVRDGARGTGGFSGCTCPQLLQVLSSMLASNSSIAARSSFSMSATCMVTAWICASQTSQYQRSDSV